jgi:integrase/recombinase XerD
MWIEGTTSDSKYIRRSLKTSSWEKASSKLKEIEDEGSPALATPTRKTVEGAIEDFIKDLRIRGMKASSMRHFTGIYENQLLAWCRAENYKYLNELDLSALREFRSTWESHAQRTKHTKQIRLKQFFKFCKSSGWIKENPVDGLGKIKVAQKPTDYFRPEEMKVLLDAALQSDPLNKHRGGRRLYALILLMRWSGLRITDAVTLERTRITNEELFLYQSKTGLPVYVPLPAEVIKALDTMPAGMKPDPRYYFWSGKGKKDGAADVMWKAFRRVAADAFPEKRAHPHMLRDTFAIEMLLAGVPLDQVSILLGHASVTMTEKHYAPWVKARQQMLSDNVKKAWATSMLVAAGEPAP